VAFTTARVLQLEVGTFTTAIPSQAKFSVLLLFPSSPPPLAAFVGSEPDVDEEEGDLSQEDAMLSVRNFGRGSSNQEMGASGPSQQEGVHRIVGNTNATHPHSNEVVVGLVHIGD
jgi:hypothetical protein